MTGGMSLGNWWRCGGAGRENYAQRAPSSQRHIYPDILFTLLCTTFCVLFVFLARLFTYLCTNNKQTNNYV